MKKSSPALLLSLEAVSCHSYGRTSDSSSRSDQVIVIVRCVRLFSAVTIALSIASSFFSFTIFLSTITVYKKERKRSFPPYFSFLLLVLRLFHLLISFFFFLLTGKVHIYTAKHTHTHTNTKTSVARWLLCLHALFFFFFLISLWHRKKKRILNERDKRRKTFSTHSPVCSKGTALVAFFFFCFNIAVEHHFTASFAPADLHKQTQYYI